MKITMLIAVEDDDGKLITERAAGGPMTPEVLGDHVRTLLDLMVHVVRSLPDDFNERANALADERLRGLMGQWNRGRNN